MTEPTNQYHKTSHPPGGDVSMSTLAHAARNTKSPKAEISHREACTSPKKFGDTCCCQSEEEAKNASHPCGHGPRCH